MPRRRKKRRKQVYDDLWDTDPRDLTRILNITGVDGVAQWFDCSRWTAWRAIRANGLKRGKDGKYTIQPPDRENPDEIDAWVKMVDARPKRGPSIVVIDAQVGRGTRPLSIFCQHEWETLVYESPIPSLATTVTRCRWCLGIRH